MVRVVPKRSSEIPALKTASIEQRKNDRPGNGGNPVVAAVVGMTLVAMFDIERGGRDLRGQMESTILATMERRAPKISAGAAKAEFQVWSRLGILAPCR